MLYAQTGKSNEISKTDFECVYEYKVTTPAGITETYSTILQIGGKCAHFYDYTVFQKDSVSQVPGIQHNTIEEYTQRVLNNGLFFDYDIYQNYPLGEMTIYGVIAPDYYCYKEQMYSISWNLTDETKIVCGYECKKAEAEFGGRKWIVWYAPDIPASFGPWKLCGLPGLVMSATDSEQIHVFDAIVFRKGSNTQIVEFGQPNVINTTKAKFLKSKNLFEKNPLGNIPSEAVSNMSVHKGDGGKYSISINGVKIRTNSNEYVPLELK